MKVLLIFIIILFTFKPAKSQHLIDTTKLWNVYKCNGAFFWGCYTKTYKFFSDSTIGSLKYSKLYETFDSTNTNWNYTALLREDTLTKKVFWRSNNNESLLYDFNLNVGDTAKVVSSWGNTSCPYSMIVDSIKYNTYFGKVRKQFYFNAPTFYGHKETWIEGIGNTWGLLDNKVAVCTTDYGPRLICYKEKSSLRYFDNYFSKCHQSTVGFKENDFVLNNIKVYPNPSHGNFIIDTGSNYEKNITIKDELGQTIFEIKNDKESVAVSLSQKGVFFISIWHSKGNWSGKIVLL
ncbi:MAG: T9SS type A sorting domain-containing protein [Bacteroidetes bacterium]|nr:T9SS type A sorting domain-containing protein [Bacteroidota bacterium]